MKLNNETAEIFITDEQSLETGLARTTHLCIAAHQDDIEIMAAQPIIECFQQKDKWFSGVVVTDGRGSPRDDLYKEYTDEEMRRVRMQEQRKAAIIGEYAALITLDYPSKIVKDSSQPMVIEDLVQIFKATKPNFVYTHNLADKHDTHVAVAVRVIHALRQLTPQERPQKLIGCEVWRSLDWLIDSDKFLMDTSQHENLQMALLGVYDSQICGGKRYDLASMGRRRTNATYFETHGVDVFQGLSFGMDLTPLITDMHLDIDGYTQQFVERFSRDITERLKRIG